MTEGGQVRPRVPQGPEGQEWKEREGGVGEGEGRPCVGQALLDSPPSQQPHQPAG